MDFDGCMMMNFRYLFIYKIEKRILINIFFQYKMCVYGIFFLNGEFLVF